MHAAEIKKLRDEINLLNNQHVAEKEQMNSDFANKLMLEQEKHKKAMKALYATISETLGEPVAEETESYSKAA